MPTPLNGDGGDPGQQAIGLPMWSFSVAPTVVVGAPSEIVGAPALAWGGGVGAAPTYLDRLGMSYSYAAGAIPNATYFPRRRRRATAGL